MFLAKIVRFEQKNVFFDFDGVIKDSVGIKNRAFEKLFAECGKENLEKIRQHHNKHTGLSRFEKIPLYLSWTSPKARNNVILEYLDKFSNIVTQQVIQSNWVPGVVEVLRSKRDKQNFFVVSATPQKEMEYILKKLSIASVFRHIIGAPTQKLKGIKMLIDLYKINPRDSVMIGDSHIDFLAASHNGIDFILRKTGFNQKLQQELDCNMINDYMQTRKF